MSFSYLLENFYFKYKIETKLLNDSAALEVQTFLSRISWFIVSNGLGESLRTVLAKIISMIDGLNIERNNVEWQNKQLFVMRQCSQQLQKDGIL